MSEVFEKVRDALALQLHIGEDMITPDSLIAEDLGADSLDRIELIMSIEEEYELTVDEKDVQHFKTVGDVVGYIEKKTLR
ncbi:MAG: acyl carrier protein [Oscillospiraceae bacterium]|jgi:acyl carrier protein|nr:acyl carrier protein [Oscillospiraceae bacterium]